MAGGPIGRSESRRRLPGPNLVGFQAIIILPPLSTTKEQKAQTRSDFWVKEGLKECDEVGAPFVSAQMTLLDGSFKTYAAVSRFVR